jgi:hypothetical protein
METVFSVCVGVGLSAACGFRVFVPLLVLSIASHTGHVPLSHGFEWLSSNPALIAFSVATALEVLGYYIPWIDHLLDTIASPAAVLAGTLITASTVGDIGPFWKWSLAIIAGGGAAGLVQGTTVATRAGSLASTGGLANPIVSTLELAGAIVTSILAIVVPVLALILLSIFFVLLGRKLLRKRAAQPVAVK